jgi:hypothetical protein
MVNVTNRADVAMRLVTFEFFLRHGSLPNMWLVRRGGGKDEGPLGDFDENRK